MKFFSMLQIELKKLRHSHIVWILLIPVFLMWLPSILNAGINFYMQAEGISPENNFLVQGFLGIAWFMYPASLVICTVLLTQTERANRGMIKMLSLPVRPGQLCMAKFVVLLLLSGFQMVMMIVMYYISAAIATQTQSYGFIQPLLLVLREAGPVYVLSIPMAALYWMIAVCVQTPVFSVGIGLATIVPSVLIINTKIWPACPSSYPMMYMSTELGRMSANLEYTPFGWTLSLAVGAAVTVLCLAIACACYGRSERR